MKIIIKNIHKEHVDIIITKIKTEFGNDVIQNHFTIVVL